MSSLSKNLNFFLYFLR